MKHKGAAFAVSVIAMIAAALALVLYILGASGSYYNDTNSTIICLLAGGILVVAATAALCVKNATTAFRLLNIIAVALIMWALMTLINMRVASIGFLLGSDLGAQDETAFQSLYFSLAAMAGMLISTIAVIIAAFTRYTRE